MKNSIIETMEIRCSIRSYSKRPLNHALQGQLIDYLNHVKHPFDANIRIELIEIKDYPGNHRLGTYGIIQNAQAFLAVCCDRSTLAEEALGYTFEKVILKCTQLGIGTCWIGGTFNKGAFADAAGLKNNEMLPIISPVGQASAKPSIMSKAMSKMTKQKSRKSFETLFFSNDWTVGLTPKTAGIFGEPLEMVRIAPSSRNCQPWKVLVDDKGAHFYRTAPRDINRIDMGIALCHFDLACCELGIEGAFDCCETAESKEPEGAFYTLSWLRKGDQNV